MKITKIIISSILILFIYLTPISFAQKNKEEQGNRENVSFNFQRIMLFDLLNAIAEIGKIEMVIEVENRPINIKIDDKSWKSALKVVAQTASLEIENSDGIFIIKPKQLTSTIPKKINNKQDIQNSPKQTLIYKLKHVPAEVLFEQLSKQPGLRDYGAGLSLDKRTNALVFIASTQQQGKLLKLLSHLDIPIPSVDISARLIIARSDVADALGVRWGGKINGRSGSARTSISGGNHGTSEGFANLGTSPMVRIGVPDLGANRITLGIPTSSNTFLDFELSALSSQGKVKILSQPTIRVQSSEKAFISSGIDVPYQVKNQDMATIEFRQATLRLEVIPKVVNDNQVLMSIKIFNDTVGQSYDGLPSLEVNQISTQVIATNRTTIVLGGIIKSTLTQMESRVPWLSEIPLLGSLFRYKSVRKENWELTAFLTPTIVK